MYERISGENPYEVPMRIYPASHYTMGGLWVDYELMTTVPGLYCAGEANFSDHGANRLGASALMQGLADGYFVLPYTIGNYLAPMLNKPSPGSRPSRVQAAEQQRPNASRGTSTSRAPARPTTSIASSARSSGTTAAWSAPSRASRRRCPSCPRCTASSRRTCASRATATRSNQTLEKAGRVDDFFQLGMLMCRDALERRESCGGHFRAEYQDEEGEAKRDDEHFAHVAAWEWTGDPMKADPQRRAARVRSRPPRHPELQVSATRQQPHQPHAQDLAPGGSRRDQVASRATAIDSISDEASFLEMLDVLNETLIAEGREPVVFDHDCREGICGTCSLMIDGQAHGPQRGTATCQLHMRKFDSGNEIVIEPWRATAFPIIKDLMVDRAAFDRIIESGGFITAQTGGAPDANLIPIPKPVADAAMDAAECIGCGACVAACPNGAANLFTAAKVTHLNLLPQGQAERYSRVEAMVETMEEYFGSCTNHGECEAACPKRSRSTSSP